MTARKSSVHYTQHTGLKYAIQFIVLLLIIVSVAFAVKMVQRQQTLNSHADIGDPSITATMAFSDPIPPNPQTIGQTFSTSVIVNTGGQPVFGVDAHIRFDQTRLQVVSVTPTQGNGFPSYPAARFKNDQGEISLSGNVGTGNAQPVTSTALNLGTIVFRVLADIDTTSVTFDFTLGNRNDSNVVPIPSDRRKGVVDILGSVSQLTITTHPIPSPSTTPLPSDNPQPSVSPSTGPTPSLTPVPSPSSTPLPVTVTFRIALQGRYGSDIGNVTPLDLTYKNMTTLLTTPLTTTADINGDVQLTVLPDNYLILVKAPSYLKRIYGTTTLPLVISPATPLIDVSTDPLLGGDFNNDGIINEVDYTAQFLPAFGGVDAATDLDGSGQVNNLDFAIMRSNWGLVDDTL